VHQQIRTSPGKTSDNIRRVLDILKAAEVNVEGIGPDFEAPHIRTAVPHAHFEQAWNALKEAHFEPELRPAVTVALANVPGQLAETVEGLVLRGYLPESILVLASRDGDRTLVSIGVRRAIPHGWASVAAELGGWEEPEGWLGGDLAPGT